MPLYSGMNEVPEQLAFGSYPGGMMPPAFGIAYQVFGDLARWVDADYALRIPIVRNCWQYYENSYFDFKKQFEKSIYERWNSKPALSRDLLNQYSRSAVEKAVQKAREILNKHRDECLNYRMYITLILVSVLLVFFFLYRALTRKSRE